MCGIDKSTTISLQTLSVTSTIGATAIGLSRRLLLTRVLKVRNMCLLRAFSLHLIDMIVFSECIRCVCKDRNTNHATVKPHDVDNRIILKFIVISSTVI